MKQHIIFKNQHTFDFEGQAWYYNYHIANKYLRRIVTTTDDNMKLQISNYLTYLQIINFSVLIKSDQYYSSFKKNFKN